MKTYFYPGFIVVAAILATLCIFSSQSESAEAAVFESFIFDGKIYTSARLIEATPLELLFVADNAPGGLRIKRHQLPSELKDKYPYDPVKASEFIKDIEVRDKAAKQQERNRIYQLLLQRERSIEAKCDTLIEQIASVQKEIKSWRARPNRPPKAVMLSQLLEKRSAIEREIDSLRKQIAIARQQQASFR